MVLDHAMTNSPPILALVSSGAATAQLVVAEVVEVSVGAAGFVAGHAAEAAVDGLAFEAMAGCLDFGDDVASCEHGRAGALVELVDGVEDGFSAAPAGVGELGL
jgi:hypothetical protein